MDPQIKPGTDLFGYANGYWIELNPVPSDLVWFSAVTEVQESVDKRIRTLIEEDAANTSADPGTDQHLIGTFYTTALDQDLADRVGLEPVSWDLGVVRNCTTREDLRNVTIDLQGRGMTPFFSLYSDDDPGNTSRMIATMEQSGTSLPDREYYFRDDSESQRVRDEFRAHVSRMFMFMNVSPEEADHDADTVLRIETRLANASAPSHGYGKPDRRYFPCPVRRLDEVTDGIDWEGLLASVDRTDIDVINLHQPLYIREVGSVLSDEPVDDLKIFLTYKILQFAAPYGSSQYEKENFNFFSRTLSGQQEMEPRWKRVLSTMDAVIGGAIGKRYIAEYFTPEEKAEVKGIVENMKETFRVRLSNVSWMDPSTRVNATAKLDAMGIQIGYPDQWGNYSRLSVSDRSYLGNIINISSYYYYMSLQLAGMESDPDVWYLSPHSVNAYYDTTRNKIVLPAGVLQPPFYDPAADDAEHYGAIGAIIGHEIIHGYDTTGRNFGLNGTLEDWWSTNDTERYMEQTAPLIEQYSSTEALPGQYMNGSRTLSENAADLGGLTLAWQAWQKTRGNQTVNWSENQTTGGNSISTSDNTLNLTDEERFFIAYAQAWRGNVRDEELRNMVLIEEHPWNRFRVNAVPFNLDEFYAAFPEIGPGDALYRNETSRARIW
ncbi:MAG TPA: M13 family metallopeptidase [Methanospirillum sp.]|nr:M13 family metallopeptidase [Methanospirillum sp.]